MQDKPTDENDDPAKIKRIMEIKRCGLNVIHIIQRWGMDEKTAFEVEAAFIDFFQLEKLTNCISGHDDERGMRWADDLENSLSAKTFVDYPNCPKFVLIKINDYNINRNGGLNDDGIYKTVKGYWPIRPDTANKYPYVLVVRYGIVVGVFKIDKDGWKKERPSDKRAYFTGVKAEKEIQDLFLNKKIPERFRKRQNPATYCD